MENLPPKKTCSEKLNPGENLPWTITLNIPTRKTESVKRKYKEISHRNSEKYSQYKISPEKPIISLSFHAQLKMCPPVPTRIMYA